MRLSVRARVWRDSRRTYESANSDTCDDGGDRAGASEASDAATCGEGTEDEADVVERLWCHISSVYRCWEYKKVLRQLTIVVEDSK